MPAKAALRVRGGVRVLSAIVEVALGVLKSQRQSERTKARREELTRAAK